MEHGKVEIGAEILLRISREFGKSIEWLPKRVAKGVAGLGCTALNKSGTWPSRTISHDRCTRLLRARRGSPRSLAAPKPLGKLPV